MIPSLPLTDLSPAARDLYRRAARDPRIHKLDNDTDIPAAAEIANAGHGTLRFDSKYGHSIAIQQYAPGFATAINTSPPSHALYIEVAILDGFGDRNGRLLACLHGADFEIRHDLAPWPMARLTVRHATATDHDHSACYLSVIEVNHPTLARHDGHRTDFIGTLHEAAIWPTGTDITLLDDRREPIDQPDMCDRCSNPHPFGSPWTPPNIEPGYQGRQVHITTLPIALAQPNGLHIDDALVTNADTE